MIGKDHAMLSMAAALLCVSPFLSVDVTMEYLESCIYFLAGGSLWAVICRMPMLPPQKSFVHGR
ncbi:hypothetical protein [Methanogenium cariaci]|uniref:hypothetical protein n=1 Tax=Methanogenium cariaci TaxID=2197 RepID=UPI0012F6840A|nr:hypothetical protein [Methanogenium cariaci]